MPDALSLPFDGFLAVHENGSVSVHDLHEPAIPFIAQGCIIVGATRARELLLAEMRQPNLPRQISEALLRALGLLERRHVSIDDMCMALSHYAVIDALTDPHPSPEEFSQSA